MLVLSGQASQQPLAMHLSVAAGSVSKYDELRSLVILQYLTLTAQINIFNYKCTCCLHCTELNAFDGANLFRVVIFLGQNDTCFVRCHFRAHPFQRLLGPSPSNGPSNGLAPIKTIKSKRHIKNRYISNFMYMSFCCSCILCSVFFTVCCEFYVILRAHPYQWPSLSLPPQEKVKSFCSASHPLPPPLAMQKISLC